MSLNLTEKSKIQIYPNEFIGHNVLNRSLLRLYDNDVIIYNSLTNDIAVTSGILGLEIDALDVRVSANEAELASLDLSGINTIVTANSGNWDWTYGIVNGNYTNWNDAYTTVTANSGLWAADGGSDTLSGLTDVNYIPSLVNTGDVLEWSASSQEWVATTPTGGGGTTPAEVSGIIEQYDDTNGWTETANAQSTTLTFTKEMSGFPLSAYNAEIRNTFYIEEDLAGDRNYEAGHSMWAPYRSVGSAMSSTSGYAWGASTTETQKRYISVNANLTVGEASLEDNFITVEGGTNVRSQMHLVWTKTNDAPNIPGDANIGSYLPMVSGNTFKNNGSDDIDKSWIMFKGLGIAEENVFSGSITDAKYYFSDCYIDLDEVTVSTPSEFIFDNSCTIDPGTASLTNLSIQNVGVPTYTTAPDGPNFAAVDGGYVVKDTNELSGFSNILAPTYGGIELVGLGGPYTVGTNQITAFDTNMISSNATPDHTNDHITINNTGDYEINFECSAEDSAGYNIVFEIKKNNGATLLAASTVYVAGTDDNYSVSCNTLKTLTKGDTIEAWITVPAGATDTQVQDPRLVIKRIG